MFFYTWFVPYLLSPAISIKITVRFSFSIKIIALLLHPINYDINIYYSLPSHYKWKEIITCTLY